VLPLSVVEEGSGVLLVTGSGVVLDDGGGPRLVLEDVGGFTVVLDGVTSGVLELVTPVP